MSIQNLNGTWQLAADPGNSGRAERWYEAARPDAQPAPVPGIVQQILPTHQGVAWYWRRFTPVRGPQPQERAWLRFAAVEYLAEVWLNGQAVGGHEGAEFPFELDVTATLQPGENLLAVRVMKPGNEPVDGFVLAELPRRNQYDHKQYQPGMSYNISGLIGKVELVVVPEVCIADLFTRPDAASGRLSVTVTARNGTSCAAAATLQLDVALAAGGEQIDGTARALQLPPGESQHELTLTVPEVRRWNLDDPCLYRVTARLGAHQHSVRCGFRDFRVTDGWFCLNGKRVFLRSSHTGNHFPIGQIVAQDPDLLRRDLIMAKATGFNCVRFIAGAAYPEQLDFCDELGLMIYQECYPAWCLGESAQMTARFERSYTEMLRRDRNHPSVTIWGLINEMPDAGVFRCAVEFLPKLRALDPTRLVLLASGRWDARPQIGSVSNPGSMEWEPVWGIESADAPTVDKKLDWDPGGYIDRAGDAHVYPPYPLAERHARQLRTLGAGVKPVFLSEFGIGSQHNAIEELRGFDRFPGTENVPDRALIGTMAKRFTADLARYRLGDVYPFPADFFRDSYRKHTFQRRLAFDLVRSNPQLCGYNLTGLLDHALTGEGLWSYWRRWKPGIVEALEDGWSPLRWCLFVSPAHVYAGRALDLEAVLATEDVLPPGEYPVCFRVFGEDGVVWEQRAVCVIAAPAPGGRLPLAVPVLKTRVNLNVPPGDYVFAADLERGGAPTGDRLPFRVADVEELPRGHGSLACWEISPEVRQWLTAHGYRCREWRPTADRPTEVVLVGNVPPHVGTPANWAGLRRRIEGGALVLLLSPEPFRKTPEHAAPWGEELTARRFHDWLYHKEIVGRLHAVFDGLPAGGILDWQVYGAVAGGDLFDCAPTPDEVLAAAFAVGYSCPGGYDSAVVVGTRRIGRGWLLFSALRILKFVGQHPAADRLLLNLIRYAQQGPLDG